MRVCAPSNRACRSICSSPMSGLPGLNGRQLADAARVAKPDLPVLFITGFAGGALGDTQLPTGMEILRKPFALTELAARIKAMLAANVSLCRVRAEAGRRLSGKGGSLRGTRRRPASSRVTDVIRRNAMPDVGITEIAAHDADRRREGL